MPIKKSNEELFGRLFANNPKRFEFMPGDKILIKELVAHVKKVMIHTGAGYFQNSQQTTTSKQVLKTFSANTRSHLLLSKLISAADKNSNLKKGGYRYDPEIKRYATYLRMIAGPLAYDTIQKNLEHSLPSLSSTNRYIRSTNCHIVEGLLRSEELLLYLKERNLPLEIIISEDATRIENRVQYDPATNQLIGFTLPTNNENGMPIPFSYPAISADEICRHFSAQNNVSSFLNLIMAQPVKTGAKPFCLLAFGSDNRYTASDVSGRWRYIQNELSKNGIKTLAFSSDSDPRYNSAMRELSQLSARNEKHISWFSFHESSGPFYIQDTVHNGTKLRNFFLRTISNEKKTSLWKILYKLEPFKFFIKEFLKRRTPTNGHLA